MNTVVLLFRLAGSKKPFPDELTAETLKAVCEDVVACSMWLEVEPCLSDRKVWRFYVDKESAEQLLQKGNLRVRGREVLVSLQVLVWCVTSTHFSPEIDGQDFCIDLTSSLEDASCDFEGILFPVQPFQFSNGQQKWAFITDEATSVALLSCDPVDVNVAHTAHFEAYVPARMVPVDCFVSPERPFPNSDVRSFLDKLNDAVLDEDIENWAFPGTVIPLSCTPGEMVWHFSMVEDVATSLLTGSTGGTITIDPNCTVVFKVPKQCDMVYYCAENLSEELTPENFIKTYARLTADNLALVEKMCCIDGPTTVWCFQIRSEDRRKEFLADLKVKGVGFSLRRGQQVPILDPVQESDSESKLKREHEKFSILLEQYSRNIGYARDPTLGFAEYWARTLAAYFCYETRRFGSPNLKLVSGVNRHPLSIIDEVIPVDCTADFSREVAPFSSVSEMIQRIRECLLEEGLDSIDGDVVELQHMWSDFGGRMHTYLYDFLRTVRTFATSSPTVDGVAMLLQLCDAANLLGDGDCESSSEGWIPLLLNAWLLLRDIDENIFDNTTSRSALYLAFVYESWNTTVEAFATRFQDMQVKCEKNILGFLQIVDFDEMVRLSDKYLTTNSHPYEGQDAIVLFGPTGAGKTTLVHAIHGAQFKEVYLRRQVHLIPRYDDPVLAERLQKFKPGYGDESETIQVSSIPVEGHFAGTEETIYIIDMPGFEETRSTELGIINSINIARSLGKCRSVRVIVVLSMMSLGDRMNVHSVQETLTNVVGILREPADVDRFSFVFTKMDSQANVAASFREGRREVNGNLQLIYQAIERKTTPTAVIVNATSINTHILPTVVMPQDAILNPIERFSHCVPERCYRDLNGQLKLEENGIMTALKTNNCKYIRAKLNMLEKMASEFPELDCITETLKSCIDKVQAEFDNTCKQIIFYSEKKDLDALRYGSLNDFAQQVIKIGKFHSLQCLPGGKDSLYKIHKVVKKVCDTLLKRAESIGVSAESYNAGTMAVWSGQIRAVQGMLAILAPNCTRLSCTDVRSIGGVYVLCFWKASSARSLRMLELLLNLTSNKDINRGIQFQGVEFNDESVDRFKAYAIEGGPCCIILDSSRSYILGRMSFETQPEDGQGMLNIFEDVVINAGVRVDSVEGGVLESDNSINGIVQRTLKYLIRCEELLCKLLVRLRTAVDCSFEASSQQDAELKTLAELSCFADNFFHNFQRCYESLCDPEFASRTSTLIGERTGALKNACLSNLDSIRLRTNGIEDIRFYMASLARIHAHARFPPCVTWAMIGAQFGSISLRHELAEMRKKIQAYIIDSASAIYLGSSCIDLSDAVCRRNMKYDCEMMEALLPLSVDSESVFAALRDGNPNSPPPVPMVTTRSRSSGAVQNEKGPKELFEKALDYIMSRFKAIKMNLTVAIHELYDGRLSEGADFVFLSSEQLSDENSVYFHRSFHYDIGELAQSFLKQLQAKAIQVVDAGGSNIHSLAKAQWAGRYFLDIIKRCFEIKEKDRVRDADATYDKIVKAFMSEFNKISGSIVPYYSSLKCDTGSIKKYCREHRDGDQRFDVAEHHRQSFISSCRSISEFLPVDASTETFGSIPDQKLLSEQLGQIDNLLKAHFAGIETNLKNNYVAIFSPESCSDLKLGSDKNQLNEMVDHLCHLLDYLNFYIPRKVKNTAAANSEKNEIAEKPGISRGSASAYAVTIKNDIVRAINGLFIFIETQSRLAEVTIAELEYLENVARAQSAIPFLTSKYIALADSIAAAISGRLSDFKQSLRRNDFYLACDTISQLKSSSKDDWEDKLKQLKERMQYVTSQINMKDTSNFWRRVSAVNNAIVFSQDLFQSSDNEYNQQDAIIQEVIRRIDSARKSVLESAKFASDELKCVEMYNLMQTLRELIDTFEVSRLASSAIFENEKVLACYQCTTKLSSLSSDTEDHDDIVRSSLICPSCSVRQISQCKNYSDVGSLMFQAERALFEKLTQVYDSLFIKLQCTLSSVGSTIWSTTASRTSDDDIFDFMCEDPDNDENESTIGDDKTFQQRFGYMKGVLLDFVDLEAAPGLSNWNQTDKLDFANLFHKTLTQIKKKFEEIVKELSGIEQIYEPEARELKVPSSCGLTLTDLQRKLGFVKQWVKVFPRKRIFFDDEVTEKYKVYKMSINKAIRLSVTTPGILSVQSLLAKQHHCPSPDVESRLSGLFDDLMRKASSVQLMDALTELIMADPMWSMYWRYGEIRPVVVRLIQRMENLLFTGETSLLQQSGNNIPKHIVGANFGLINYFLTSESILRGHLVDSDHLKILSNAIKKLKAALKSTIISCCEDIESADKCLNKMESVISLSKDADVSNGTSIIQRFRDTWSDVCALEKIIVGVINGLLDYLFHTETDFVDTKMFQKAFTIADRFSVLTQKANHYVDSVVLDDKIPRLRTLNIVDKKTFYLNLFFTIQVALLASDVPRLDMLLPFQKKFDKAISGLCDFCRDQLILFRRLTSSYVLNDAVTKPQSEVFNSFGVYGLQNLLVISEVFDGEIKRLALESFNMIGVAVMKEIKHMLELIHISDAEWESSTQEYATKVSKVFIIIKQIEMTVSWTKSLSQEITEKIVESLQYYAKKEGGPMFINKMYNILRSDGIGTKLLEADIFRHFATAHKNSQFRRVSLEEVVSGMRCEGPGGSSRDDMKSAYKRYFVDDGEQGTFWNIVHKYLHQKERYKIYGDIPREVNTIANRILTRNGDIIDQMWKLICYCFAYWTLSPRSLEAYDRTPGELKQSNHLIQPHPGQVIAIVRLLGLDVPEQYYNQPPVKRKREGQSRGVLQTVVGWFAEKLTPASPPTFKFDNHLAEIKTGEGKSVVLAVVAAILALLGFNCDIVCYSDDLSKRDHNAFDFLFSGFKIKDHVRYVTFKTLAKLTLDSTGSVSKKLEDVILGRSTSSDPVPQRATRHSILLIDEVDVLFSSNFYGKTFDILSQLKGNEFPDIALLFNEVYKYKNHDPSDLVNAWDQISNSDIYKKLTADGNKLGDWSFIITSAVVKMLSDITSLSSHKFHAITAEGVGYLDNDNRIVFNMRKGYHTVFELMKVNENDKSLVTDAMVKQMQNILVTVGALSYAEIPRQYTNIMGVTGTLDCVTDDELRQYNITRKTFMRTAYPTAVLAAGIKRIPFKGEFNEDVIPPSANSTHFDNICDQIDTQSKNGLRPVLVFFKDEAALKSFRDFLRFQVKYGENTSIMVPACRAQENINTVENATSPGRITLLVAIYGRGTDFQYDDATLDKNGGVHVIITYFPTEESDQIQLQGRTARQGHPGSVSMVLDVPDFETGGINYSELDSLQSRKVHILRRMSTNRGFKSAAEFQLRIELALEKKVEHDNSQEILRLLFENRTAQLMEKIKERNITHQPLSGVLSRTMIMIDGTGSMSRLITHVKTKIKMILQRIQEVVKDQCSFEVQIVVYRNYNCSLPAAVLETSQWARDPSELEHFVDSITLGGGVGGPEAIEMGLKYARMEIEAGRRPTQIVLVGDQGPMGRGDIEKYRNKVESQGLSGERLWQSLSPIYASPTYWEDEVPKIASAAPKFHAFYLPWYDGTYPAKDAFKAIHSSFVSQNAACEGTYMELRIHDRNGAQKLADILIVKILQDLTDAMKKRGVNASYVQDYASMFHVDLNSVDGYID